MNDSVSDKSRTDRGDTHYENGVNGGNEKGYASYVDGEQPDPELDNRITRKFDKRVVPWLFGMWLLAFLDRANIGNAQVAGLSEDTRLEGNQFNIALAVFYIPYICVDIPSNLVLKYFRAGFDLPALLIGFRGLACTFQGFVKNFGGLVAARFFLGLCEGGLLGGMVIFLAMFYRRHELLKRIGLFYSAAPLSGAWGGLLATGLSKIETKGYKGWPFIFVRQPTEPGDLMHADLKHTVCGGLDNGSFWHSSPLLPPAQPE